MEVLRKAIKIMRSRNVIIVLSAVLIVVDVALLVGNSYLLKKEMSESDLWKDEKNSSYSLYVKGALCDLKLKLFGLCAPLGVCILAYCNWRARNFLLNLIRFATIVCTVALYGFQFLLFSNNEVVEEIWDCAVTLSLTTVLFSIAQHSMLIASSGLNIGVFLATMREEMHDTSLTLEARANLGIELSENANSFRELRAGSVKSIE